MNQHIDKILNLRTSTNVKFKRPRKFYVWTGNYGFILSLQFTNNGNDEPYMSKADVESFLDTSLADFHNVNQADIIANGSGMIDIIKAAYGNTLMID